MFMRTVYDDRLAQAAYIFGCQRTGEAIVIDPQRDIERYVHLARQHGLRLVAAAETHIHADFLSGARELAERSGARVYLSDCGDDAWKYGWIGKRRDGGSYDAKLLGDGDAFRIGQVEFRAIHTPGHTPEHICFQVTDRGGGASEPLGIATGDFMFVGDLGRPDLLESAAGQRGAAEPAAHRLYQSVQRIASWPEFAQVWPGHGAGSACGKALGAVPQSTVGYERRFNAALRHSGDERGFVASILAGQPEPPAYFARMKQDNRDGPAILGGLPNPPPVDAAQLAALPTDAVVLDTRPWPEFRRAHLPRSLNVSLDSMFPTLAGSYIDPARDVYILADEHELFDVVCDLVHVGIDRVRGWIPRAALPQYAQAGGALAQSRETDVSAARDLIASRSPTLLDVRSDAEFADGHIDGARRINYTRLSLHAAELPRDRPVLVNCRSGARSARACAYLEHLGFEAINLVGGVMAWEQAGLPLR